MKCGHIRSPRSSDEAGFTLVEALVSTVLMVAIMGALATVTAQWMRNWNHGFDHVQQTELAAGGLERIVADLSAAEFIPPLGTAKTPIFEGRALVVTFVRSALGPNTQPGLEFVRIGEMTDAQEFAMVRARAPFVPITEAVLNQVRFNDPVVLVRGPYRISFAYAGPNRIWRNTWLGETELPAAIQVTVRNAVTAQALAISTVAVVHVDAPADCVRAKNPKTCNTPKLATVE